MQTLVSAFRYCDLLGKLIVVLLVVFGPKKPCDSEAAVETTTAAATVMTIENTLESEGEVTSSLEEDLSPHTSYYLDEVKVEAGDALEEGDTILTYTNGSKRDITSMKCKFTVSDVIAERRLFLIDPINSLRNCKALLIVIIDEHLLLKYAAHVLYRWLVVDPVICVSFRNKDFSSSWGNKKIGFDVAHH